MGSVIRAQGLSRSTAYGIFADQGSNLYQQADSLPLIASLSLISSYFLSVCMCVRMHMFSIFTLPVHSHPLP